jgi:hypothetical protein
VNCLPHVGGKGNLYPGKIGMAKEIVSKKSAKRMTVTNFHEI